MFKTIVEGVFPVELDLNPHNTLFKTLLCRPLTIKTKTTVACIGDHTPSRHETIGRTLYRIPRKEHAGAVTDEDRVVHDGWLFLMRYSKQARPSSPL